MIISSSRTLNISVVMKHLAARHALRSLIPRFQVLFSNPLIKKEEVVGIIMIMMIRKSKRSKERMEKYRFELVNNAIEDIWTNNNIPPPFMRLPYFPPLNKADISDLFNGG